MDDRKVVAKGTLDRLPLEVFLAIIMLLMELVGSAQPMAVVAVVCRRWNAVTTDPVLWDFATKRYFAAYPLIRRLSATPDQQSPHYPSLVRLLPAQFPCGGVVPTAMIRGLHSLFQPSKKIDEATTNAPAPSNPVPSAATLRKVPSRKHLQRTFEELGEFKRHLDKKRLVAQQRAFVLHVMIFASVLLFTFFVFVSMLAAEGVTFLPEVFHFDNAFFLLWLIITLVFLTLISNIVMETHFEPMPCAERIMRHINLIVSSTAFMVVALLTVALPLYLIQHNLDHGERDRLPWVTCASPLILAFFLWQAEILMSMKERLLAWLQAPHLSGATVHAVVVHSTPFFCGGACLSLGHYAEHQQHLYLVLGTIPLFFILSVLFLIFMLDFFIRQRPVDLMASLCFLVAASFPPCLWFLPVRGLSLLPAFLALSGFVAGYAHELYKLPTAFGDDEES